MMHVALFYVSIVIVLFTSVECYGERSDKC